MSSTNLVQVPFHGATLLVTDYCGEPYVVMKPIVEGMGLAWQPQHKKLNDEKERWGCNDILIPTEKGGIQDCLCMPFHQIGAWLMTINSRRVKPAIRDTVIAYQKECAGVLWKYWKEGIAVNPRKFNEDEVVQASLDEMERMVRVFGQALGEQMATRLRQEVERTPRAPRTPRQPPATPSYRTSPEQWWQDCLRQGAVLPGQGWPCKPIPKATVYAAYVDWCQPRNVTPEHPTVFGKCLQRYRVRTVRPRPKDKGRPRCYLFPRPRTSMVPFDRSVN
jgi:hypothetical protein